MTEKKPRRRPRKKADAPPGAKGGAAGPVSSRPPARRAPRGRRSLSGPLVVLAAVAALAVGGYLALILGYGTLHGPGGGREVELEWPSGVSADAAAERLAAAGLIANPGLFAVYLRLTASAGALRPGPHLLTDDLSPRAIVRRLERSLAGEHAKITIPEGWHRFDIARRLAQTHICGARAFLDATTDRALLAEIGVPGDSAEGFLFPATYDLPLDSDPREVVRRLEVEFDRRIERLMRARPGASDALRAAPLGFGIREIVTLASVVEKEAAVDEERPVIASVFLNRLRDPSFTPKRLQSDATTSYGCLLMPERVASCRTFAGKATPELNGDESNPYSTYRHDGLPPGPVANPGERSLDAVLAPADTRYFYFVARGEGRHAFSETYAQHNEAIRATRR